MTRDPGQPEDALNLVSEALADRHGDVYARRWLEERRAKGTPVPVRRASGLEPPPPPAPEALSGPLRPSAGELAASTVIAPEQAREEALGRFEAHAEARAAKLRARVGWGDLVLRRDRRARLERFHTSLVQLALAVAVKRRYREACTLTVHTVLELVGYCLGVGSSSTLYSYLHTLKGLGLIDFRGHVTTITLPGGDGGGREVNRCDGALLCIRLGGCQGARLSRHDYGETHRDLQGDIRRGHTAFRLMKKLEGSLEPPEHRERLNRLILWSLNPARLFGEGPLERDPSDWRSLVPAGYPTELFDVAGSKNRNAAVGVAAEALARALGDTPNLGFYRRLVWQLLRAFDRGWDFFRDVYAEAVRALADKREGYARRPGALLVSRLKRSGCWDELWRDPGQWVGGPVVA